MGQIMTPPADIARRHKEKHLLVLGLEGAGKTCILNKVRLNALVVTTPTIIDVERVEYKGTTMAITDVGGQICLRPLWRTHFVSTDALIYVVDSSDHERIEEAKDEMLRALRNPDMDDCKTVLIFLSKQDIPGAVAPDAAIERLGLHDDNQLKGRNWHIQGCCVITGEGVHEGLEWLCGALHNA